MTRRTFAVPCLLAVLFVTACGGGGSGSKTVGPPSAKPSAGGAVKAQPTNGLLGPAEVVAPGVTHVIGKTGPLPRRTGGLGGAKGNGVGGGVACASASASPSSQNLRSMSAAIVCLLNGQRRARGMAPLHVNARLGRASRGMATLMVRQRFFAHDTPSGRSLLDRVRTTGYVRGRWQLGENLAWGSGSLSTPGAIVNGWMHSPGHKANILHASFKDIGIGIQLGAPQQGLSGGATYVTDFGRHG